MIEGKDGVDGLESSRGVRCGHANVVVKRLRTRRHIAKRVLENMLWWSSLGN